MSDDDYELLPGDSLSVPHSRRRMRRGRLSRLLRPMKLNPSIMFYASLILFVCSVGLTTHNFLEAHSATTNEYYNTILNALWPVGLPNRTDVWENENSKAMHALMSCMSANSCRENQTSIIMLSSEHFAGSIAGKISGEDIWALSVLDALRQYGYTTIFTTDIQQMAATYRQFPDLVKVVILEGKHSHACFKDPRCIKTQDHPLGIPLWKMLSFYFWTGPAHPLGSAWTLSPENYALSNPKDSAENVYLGYSIEKVCQQIPTTPFADRPRQAYILAKNMDYFGKDYTWSGIELDKPPFDVSFLAGIRQKSKTYTLPKGINDLGLLNKTQFYHHLSESRVLLGVGQPRLSPSPYDALCMGVPFINPIRSWDEKDPENRMKWSAQHEVLKFHDPPYVYNVKKNDEPAFWDALQKAMESPFDSYILPNMTMEALKARVSRIMEEDWRGKAERLLEERISTGKGDIFEM